MTDDIIGTIKFYFTHDKFTRAEMSFYVDFKQGDEEIDSENIAYGLLQDVFPDTWHDWRLTDTMEV